MESNNSGSYYTMDDIKKKFKNALIISISLIFAGVVIAIVLAVSFVGEDGYIRDDAPGEWLFVSFIPIILGMIMLLLPLNSTKKLAESNKYFGTSNGLSLEQSVPDLKDLLNPLKNAKMLTIIVAALFFGILLVLTLLGEISWTEFFDAIF